MSDCLILYILHHMACNTGAESMEILVPDSYMSGIYTRIFSLHAAGPQYFSASHLNF